MDIRKVWIFKISETVLPLTTTRFLPTLLVAVPGEQPMNQSPVEKLWLRFYPLILFYKQNNIYRPDFRTASLRITDFLLEDEFVFSEKWNNNETIF